MCHIRGSSAEVRTITRGFAAYNPSEPHNVKHFDQQWNEFHKSGGEYMIHLIAIERIDEVRKKKRQQ